MSIQKLREQKNALSNQANNLLANKGDQVWTKEDQQQFDNISAQIELVTGQIDAHQKMLDDAADIDYSNLDKNPKKMSAARKGLDLFLRKQSKELNDEEFALIRNTMSTTTGSEGGNTVQPEVSTMLIDLMKAFGFMRGVASQVTTSNGADLSFPTSDGTSEVGEWVAQNVNSADLDPTFGTLAVNVFKAGSKVVAVPIELLQDSQIDIAAFIFKRLAERIGRISNQGYTVGTGTGQPRGLVTAAATGKVGTTGQTTTIIYDDLVDVVDSLDIAYLASGGTEPGFMFGQTLRRTIRKLKDTTGRPIWTPGYEAGITAQTPDLLMGYPVYINNDMPTPAANAESLAFGKLDAYLIRDAMDITLFKFEDSAFTRKGQIGYMAWARTGGNLLDVNAVKTYQHSAT